MLTHDWIVFYDGILVGLGIASILMFGLLAVSMLGQQPPSKEIDR